MRYGSRIEYESPKIKKTVLSTTEAIVLHSSFRVIDPQGVVHGGPELEVAERGECQVDEIGVRIGVQNACETRQDDMAGRCDGVPFFSSAQT